MMGANMERDMRQQLFDHYEELSFSYYSQNNSVIFLIFPNLPIMVLKICSSLL